MKSSCKNTYSSHPIMENEGTHCSAENSVLSSPSWVPMVFICKYSIRKHVSVEDIISCFLIQILPTEFDAATILECISRKPCRIVDVGAE